MLPLNAWHIDWHPPDFQWRNKPLPCMSVTCCFYILFTRTCKQESLKDLGIEKDQKEEKQQRFCDLKSSREAGRWAFKERFKLESLDRSRMRKIKRMGLGMLRFTGVSTSFERTVVMRWAWKLGQVQANLTWLWPRPSQLLLGRIFKHWHIVLFIYYYIQ